MNRTVKWQGSGPQGQMPGCECQHRNITLTDSFPHLFNGDSLKSEKTMFKISVITDRCTRNAYALVTFHQIWGRMIARKDRNVKWILWLSLQQCPKNECKYQQWNTWQMEGKCMWGCVGRKCTNQPENNGATVPAALSTGWVLLATQLHAKRLTGIALFHHHNNKHSICKSCFTNEAKNASVNCLMSHS